METVYIAGGCLGGVQHFFDSVPGVLTTEAGRANGKTDSLDSPYDGYAECVKVVFDEKKLMEYDSNMYAKAKEAQAAMAAIKEKQKEYDSLWDGDEGENYDPEGVANSAQAEGDLPEIPEPEEISVEEPSIPEE
jgi:uncharacterized protein YfcZ (UPF0381/DUF406 family)